MGVGEAKHPCPCCGYLVLDEPGMYEICPICNWEDDISQLRFATMPGGANKLSLLEAQRTFAETGTSDPAAVARVRPPASNEERDPGWRPIQGDDIEVPLDGVDYGQTYPPSCSQLYYWRPEYFRRVS